MIESGRRVQVTEYDHTDFTAAHAAGQVNGRSRANASAPVIHAENSLLGTQPFRQPESIHALRASVLNADGQTVIEQPRPADTQFHKTAEARAASNKFRARLHQLADNKKILSEPSMEFKGDWTEVTADISREWIKDRRKHSSSNISRINLARMKALEYERRHRKGPDALPDDRRLLKTAKKKDYYNASIEAYLLSIGEDNPQEVIDSFELAATGGLHRQKATEGTALSYLLSGIGLLQSSGLPSAEPVSALGFSLGRLATQIGTAGAVIQSGREKLRNTGTEDIVQDGRGEAAPRAREAPDLLQTSRAVSHEMPGSKKNVQRMETALENLKKAQADLTAGKGSEAAVQQCHDELVMIFGRICYQLSVKDEYKAASESAKIEIRGNLRNLIASYTSSFFAISVGAVSILAPLFIDFAVSGGLTTAAAALTLSTYIGYQLSKGPAKDSGDKGKRAIVALVKLLEVLSDEQHDPVKEWGDAWGDLHDAKKKSRYSMPGNKKRIREEARLAYMERSKNMLHNKRPEDRLTAEKNHADYVDYWQRLQYGKELFDQGLITREQFKAAADEEDAAYNLKLNGKVSGTDAASVWRTPMDMRMQAAERILRGSLARTKKHMQNLRNDDKKRVWHTSAQAERIEEKYAALRKTMAQNIMDLTNFELGMAELKKQIAGKDEDPEVDKAAKQLNHIQDENVRALFCGNSQEQVEAMRVSKELTAGEVERYTLTNNGFAAIGISLNVGVQVVDVSLSGLKLGGDHSLPHVSDFKLAQISQANQQIGISAGAGDRAAVRHRDFRKQQRTLESLMKPEEIRMHLDERCHLGLTMEDEGVNSEIERMVTILENSDHVPTQFAVQFHKNTSTIPAPTDKPTLLEPGSQEDIPGNYNIVSKLNKTSAFHRVLYKKADRSMKTSINLQKVKLSGKHALMSLIVLPEQAVAVNVLKHTRQSNHKAKLMVSDVHDALQGSVINQRDIVVADKENKIALEKAEAKKAAEAAQKIAEEQARTQVTSDTVTSSPAKKSSIRLRQIGQRSASAALSAGLLPPRAQKTPPTMPSSAPIPTQQTTADTLAELRQRLEARKKNHVRPAVKQEQAVLPPKQQREQLMRPLQMSELRRSAAELKTGRNSAPASSAPRFAMRPIAATPARQIDTPATKQTTTPVSPERLRRKLGGKAA